MERTVVIGDIHGCHRELMELLDDVGPGRQDRIICVGDVITKGPGNRDVLEFLRRTPGCESLLGNHEHMLLKYQQGLPVALKREHFQTIEELGGDFDSYMQWIMTWPHYIELEDYLIVHAGIRPDRPLVQQSVDDLTELRCLDGPNPGSRHGTPWFERHDDSRTVVFGHWVFDTPLLLKNAIGLDTGCVYGGWLTAVVLPERRLVSVRAREAYATNEKS